MISKINLKLRSIAIHFFMLLAGLSPSINAWSVENPNANEMREICHYTRLIHELFQRYTNK